MNPVDISTLLSHQEVNKISSALEFPLPCFVVEDRKHMYKDAIVFSGHKFLGGPGCPGVLVVKKDILLPTTLAPTIPGGGTVFYVTDNHHRYLSNREEREEAGTPNIVGDIRLGLVMNLKQHTNNLLKQCAASANASTNASSNTSAGASPCTASSVEQLELEVSFRIQKKLESIPNLVLLGRIPLSPSDDMSAESVRSRSKYLPIFSFLVKYQTQDVDIATTSTGTSTKSTNSHKKNLFLHYNFVCSLMNDLFGIQVRGGCQCAGPFSQQLLGLVGGKTQTKTNGTNTNVKTSNTNLLNDLYEISLLDKHEVLRPGYSRLSIPYWMENMEEYIVNAISIVCQHGLKFLPYYK